MNILMTSVNWRAEIVHAIAKSIKRCGRRNKLITVDTDPLAVGMYFGDARHRVPSYADRRYTATLKSLCKKERISFIIPQTDRDCNYFAGHKKTIESWGVRILMPEPAMISILNDKIKAQEYFRKHAIPTPRQYTLAKLRNLRSFPLVVKPRRDSGSTDVYVVNDRNGLLSSVKAVQHPIVEEFIEGDEFTVDGAANLDHSIIGLVPRKRIKVKAGISIKGVTVYDKKLLRAARTVSELIDPVGFYCLQFIKSKKDDNYYLIEVNPRIGSGIVLSMAAGLDIGKIFSCYAKGSNCHYKEAFYKKDLYMLQYLKPFFKEG